MAENNLTAAIVFAFMLSTAPLVGSSPSIRRDGTTTVNVDEVETGPNPAAVLVADPPPNAIVVKHPQTSSDHPMESQAVGESAAAGPTTAIYVVPEEGTAIVFRCAAADDSRLVAAWTLPNGERVQLDGGSMANGSALKSSWYGSFLKFTKYELTIYEVQLGMDGRYVCIFESGSNETAEATFERNFYIPYIVSHVSFPRSVTLSAGISVAFCLICVLVLWINSSRRRPREEDEDEFMGRRSAPYGSETAASRRSAFAVSHGSCAPSWSVADATEAELEVAAAERKKYLSRSFSTVGFDEILPTCVEREEEEEEEEEEKVGTILAQPQSQVLDASTLPQFHFYSPSDNDDDEHRPP